MTTINKRASKLFAMTINTITNGGLMTLRLLAGYDNVLQTPVDGLQFPMGDRLTEFVRGNMTGQDWVRVIELLTGVIGTSVHYERKSGTAEATGYIKHTLKNPVIHRAGISLIHRGYGSGNANFECKAADETEGIADLWVPLDSQAAPAYISSARGIEITACVFGAINVYHVTQLDFNIVMQLVKASHDGDVGYTAVDVMLGGSAPSGTLVIQDSEITTAKLKAQELLAAARGSLVLSVKQAGGATAKTLTIAGVEFTSMEQNLDVGADYNSFSLPFIVTNNVTTPLTLAGANKIITIT